MAVPRLHGELLLKASPPAGSIFQSGDRATSYLQLPVKITSYPCPPNPEITAVLFGADKEEP